MNTYYVGTLSEANLKKTQDKIQAINIPSKITMLTNGELVWNMTLRQNLNLMPRILEKINALNL